MPCELCPGALVFRAVRPVTYLVPDQVRLCPFCHVVPGDSTHPRSAKGCTMPVGSPLH